MPLRLAVNRGDADVHTPLHDGDELALIPPVSGGAPELDSPAARHVRVTSEALSLEPLMRSAGDSGTGVIVVFQGVTRDVPRLEYEAYEEMAQTSIETILQDWSISRTSRSASELPGRARGCEWHLRPPPPCWPGMGPRGRCSGSRGSRVSRPPSRRGC
jgi:hypothetical protein